jgi:hypothetical protein
METDRQPEPAVVVKELWASNPHNPSSSSIQICYYWHSHCPILPSAVMLPNTVKHPARAGRASSSIFFGVSVLPPDHRVDVLEMHKTFDMFRPFATGPVLYSITPVRGDPDEL